MRLSLMQLMWMGFMTGISWAQLDTIFIHSSNIVCQTCRRTIIRGLSTQRGIRYVEVDVPRKKVLVVYRRDKTDAKKIRESLAQLGYDADDISRDLGAFERLPACCKVGHAD
ncbi:MAG: heavy-metal-associated domain-containing protein [Bacteroidia bacterium]|nr:heavy-metal-associated domain-containing protein [Bacteroidia bacterium]